jgi:hypothetical protein
LQTLIRCSGITVELDVRAGSRLPERIEVGTYYVVSEVSTKAAKHGR